MSVTNLAAVSEQVEKFWSPVFSKTLRANLLLGSLVNRDYEGQIKQQGDTVYVTQIADVTGQLKTVGTDADTFDSHRLQSTRIEIKADKRAVAAVEIADLAELQSQLGSQDSAIRNSLQHAVEQEINDYLFSLVAPSTSAPDHLINSVTDMNAAQVATVRMLAAQAKWDRSKPWYGLLDPSYYSDVLNAATLTSSDYIGEDMPIVGGQVVKQRYGFNLLEDNSRGTDKALFFHPDFMHLVMQQGVRFKLSDLHSQKKFGYLLSVDLVFGAKLGHDGAKKHIVCTAAASGSEM